MDDALRRFVQWFVALVSFVVGFYFSFWIVFGVGAALIARTTAPAWISLPGSAILGGLVARTVFRRLGARGDDGRSFASLVGDMAYGALAGGLIGFAGGFFGPMIFSPGANQGPLLGIFITGPLGLVLGAIGGVIYWFVAKKQA